MTLRIVLVLVWLVQAACTFRSPSGSGGPDGRGDGVSDAETDAPAPSCTDGQPCNDMKACTAYDVCAAGVCLGVPTSACSPCASTCDATCGGGSCCAQSCPGGNCPACPAGCSCDLGCGESRPCRVTCNAGSVCNLSGTNLDETDGDYTMTCAAGSVCSLDCVGDDGACTIACSGTAKCLLDCRDKVAELSKCNITGCSGPVISCTGAYAGVKVCNRPCPT